MGSPHAVLVARSRANVNRHLRERLGQNPETPQTLPAMLGVWMTHVKRALYASDLDAASCCFPEESLRESCRYFIGHLWQTGACHAHLHATEAMGLRLVEPRLERSCGVGAKQDADLRQRAIRRLLWALRVGSTDGGDPGQS